MKYEVTFSCGHTDVVELFGPTRERDRKLDYFENFGLCPKCYREQREIEKSIGCEEVKMKYKEYKENYSNCDVQAGSYNPEDKTVIVYVPEELV